MLTFLPTASSAVDYPNLNTRQISWIGEKIFNNECRQQIECLTAWNQGEDFPSLGIGHFIWYRADQKEAFEESFPALLEHFRAHSIELPGWLAEQPTDNAPWPNRKHFLDEFNNSELSELRLFLQTNIPAQTEFIILRFEGALNKIIISSPQAQQSMLKSRFLQVANSSPPYGLYALIDYVNFKGEGTSPLERYNDQGWGLRQVLENMPEGSNNLQQFVASAQQILTRRVSNSLPERNEARWLQGWLNRLNTYLPPTASKTEKQ